MKKTSLGYCLVVTSILINAIAIPPTFAAAKAKVAKPQTAGRIAIAPSNTILNGTSAPKPSLGINGDFYIDTKALNIYGPKAKGRWPAAVSLRGPQGHTGATGTSGNNGKSGANLLAAGPQGSPGSNGPKGEVGSRGDVGATGTKGEVGAKGEVGTPGSSGAAGPKGEMGTVGPAGASGSSGAPGAQGAAGPQGISGAQGAAGGTGAIGPQGPVGATGSTGAQGATGGTGVQGNPGAAGDPGAVGATGPSNSFFGAVIFVANIQGVEGSSQLSNPFGSFAAGKSYLMRVFIQTFNATKVVSTYPLALSVSASGGTPSISSSYSISNGSFWVSGAQLDEVSIIADIAIDGSLTASAYQLVVTVTCGMNSGSFPITLLGNYSSTLVGQIN